MNCENNLGTYKPQYRKTLPLFWKGHKSLKTIDLSPYFIYYAKPQKNDSG